MPSTATTSTRTFGIELEVVQDVRTVYRALLNAGCNVRLEGYNHDTRPHWKVVTDGSVTGGAEVVSPVLTGDEGIQEARKIAQALTDAGITVDRRCGFHVHIGGGDLTADNLKALIKRYAAFEAEIDGFMPRSRRGTSNYYCRPMQDHAQAVDRMNTQDATAVARGLGDRYRKLNVQSLWRQGTVEFRHHSGTVDPDKIENWVRFCAAFVDASKGKTVRAATPGYTPRTDYIRRERRNWAEVIEQVEMAGGTMEAATPRSRTYVIRGGGGRAAHITVAQLTRLYAAPTSYDLHPVRFAEFWHNTVAPVLGRPAGEVDAAQDDTVFAGMSEDVAAFFRLRARRLSGAAI